MFAAIALAYFCVKKARAGKKAGATGRKDAYGSGVDATAVSVTVSSVSATIDVGSSAEQQIEMQQGPSQTPKVADDYEETKI